MIRRQLISGESLVQCKKDSAWVSPMLISPRGWNRLAHGVIGNSLATDVVASAKFYAQLNYALANAAIASWDSK
jgi:hypothetical protein